MRLQAPTYLTNIFHHEGGISPQIVTSFRAAVYAYHRANPRPMPWRETGDPYRILVSEIMLQQTQVDRVRAKYTEFMGAFPTVHELAAAPLSDVLQVWQGLGYNRRGLYLKRCSEEIVRDYAGHFPRTIDELQSLPGITLEKLLSILAAEQEPVERNLEALQREGFLVKQRCGYRVTGEKNRGNAGALPLI